MNLKEKKYKHPITRQMVIFLNKDNLQDAKYGPS